MNNNVNEKLMQVVQNIEESARRAEEEYERKANALQEKTREKIDLFGNTATSQVIDIVSESRKICDTLYATYQMLIGMLDAQCRPLLEENPGIHRICAVRNLVKWLNDESEIENNFAASLNAHNLGDVANVRYIPQIENKMIQTFWETTYFSHPDRETYEQKQIEIQKAHVKAVQKSNEERREEEIVKQEVYHKNAAEWEISAAEVRKNREEEIQKQLTVEEENLRNEYEDAYNNTLCELNASKKSVEEQCELVRKNLSELTFFQFAEKKQLNDQLKDLEKKLLSIVAELEQVEENHKQILMNVNTKLEEKKVQIQEEVEQLYPLPTKIAPLYTQRPKTFQDKMVEILQKHGGLMTIDEIIQACPEAQEKDFREVASQLRSMIALRVERCEAGRQAYFRALEKAPREETAILEYLSKTKIATFRQVSSAPVLKNLNVKKISVALCVLLDNGKIIRYMQDGEVFFTMI